MDERSAIAWMIMGGPGPDEHNRAERERRLALFEQHLDWERTGSRGRMARLVSFLDRWTARPAATLTTESCTTAGCTAA